MSDSYSVRARLSAQDSGFTSTFKRALGTMNDLKSQVKSGLAFGVLQGVGQAAFHSITSSVKGLISEIDSSNASWKTFTKNMQMLGKSEKEIASVKKELQDFAQKTIYSSSDMATTFAQLEAVGVKNTTKLVKGFGGLAAAAENPQQAMKTLSQQATQMAAKPNVAWQDFKLMLEQTPAGIAAVAKEMGMTTSELVTKIQDGEVSTDKFFDAIAKVGTNKAFTELATEAKTVGQAMDGLKETLGNKLTPAFEVLNKKGISIIDTLGKKLEKVDATKLATKVENAVVKIGKYFNAAKEAFSGVGTEIWGAIKEIGSALFGLEGSFGSTDSVEGFKETMKGLANFLKGVAGFCKDHAKEIATLIKWLPAIAIGIKGFRVASAVAPAVSVFAKGIAKLAGKGISGIASKLFGISKSQKKVGDSSVKSSKKLLNSAKAYALMGVAVLAIAAGFALLAFSAISLANAGGGAIAVMAGLVVALAGIGVGMAYLLKMLAPMSKTLIPAAGAMALMGVAVIAIAAGFAILAATAIALANAGGAAIGVMAGLVVVMALLAVGAVALAPALAAGAAGFIPFGAAVLMVGAGLALCGAAALLAATALKMIASVLPTLAASGLQGALAITALGASLLAFTVGAAAAGLACTILAVGLVAVGVAVVVLAAGMLALSVAILAVSASLLLASTALMALNLALPLTIQYGGAASVAMLALSVGLLALGAAALVASAGLIALGIAAVAATAGIIAFGAGMTVAAVGTAVMLAALVGINSQMKSIAKNAKTAQKSLKSMQSSVKAVESGLNALGSKAKAALNQLKQAFDDSAVTAVESGKRVGQGFTNSVVAGLSLAPVKARATVVSIVAALNAGKGGASGAGSATGQGYSQGIQSMLSAAVGKARSIVSSVISILNSAKSKAQSAGANVSKGFAQGIQSCYDTVKKVAGKIATVAKNAIEKVAKIHSPSKVADKLGYWWGTGYGDGLADTSRYVWNAAEKLVTIPKVATPDLAMAYSGELSSDYDYYRNEDYTIEVPLTLDGREVARATAKYTKGELDKQQSRDDRKRGKI